MIALVRAQLAAIAEDAYVAALDLAFAYGDVFF